MTRKDKINETNITPIPNKIKTVNLGVIEIFFNEKVGTLLIKKKATNIVIQGDRFFILMDVSKFDRSNINGIKISIPPAGDGIPSKQFFFQESFSSYFVKLNLANLRTQQTEQIRVIAQPTFP